MTPISSAIADFLPWAAPKLISTDEEHERVLAIIESMMNQELEPEQEDLFELLVTLVEKYENERYPMGDESSPRDVLEFLMDQKNIKQEQLIGVLGSRGTVSDIINGRREISKKQAKVLGEFFSIDYTLFL